MKNEFGIEKKSLKLPLKEIKYTEKQLEEWSEKYGIGYETLKDVMKELQRPGLDPREEIEPPVFKSDVLDIKDVKI